MKLLKNVMMVVLVSYAALSSDLCGMKKVEDPGVEETKSGDEFLDYPGIVTKASAAMELGGGTGLVEALPACGGAGGEADDVPASAAASIPGSGKPRKDFLGNIPSHMVIDLCAPFLDEESLKALSETCKTMREIRNSSISSLKCSHTQIVVSKMKQCPELKKLRVGGSVTAAEAIAALPEDVGSQLEELSLGLTNLNISGVYAAVRRFSTIKKLTLTISMDGLSNCIYIRWLPEVVNEQLEELHMRDIKVDSDLMRKIVNRCPNLRVLNFRCSEEVVESIEELPDDISLLFKEVYLSGTGTTANQVREIVRRCPILKELYLNNCVDVAGFIEGLDEVVLPLQVLDLSGTGATADQVREIVRRCPNLKKLNLRHCVGVAGFIEGFEDNVVLSLKELDLRYTYPTSHQWNAIRRKFPFCELY